MNNKHGEVFATVTYAVYDEPPIACQGDDDQRKIKVVRERIRVGGDAHAHTEALERSVALSAGYRTYAQVWEVEMHSSQDGAQAEREQGRPSPGGKSGESQ